MLLKFAILALVGCALIERPPPAALSQVPDPITAPEPLNLRIEMPDEAPPGVVVPYRVVLANGGDTAVSIELEGIPITFEVVAHDTRNDAVWRSSKRPYYGTTPVIRSLDPGEIVVFEGHWDQRDSEGTLVLPGTYRIRAVLPVMGVPGGWGSNIHLLTIVS